MKEQETQNQETKATEEAQVAEEAKTQSQEEVLTAQLAEANDKYLRMLAEYDNFRRRSQKEKEHLWSEAVADTVGAILPIADNLERASAALGDPEAIREGLAMIDKALSDTLTRLGVEAYGEKGEPFDPARHNAVMHTEDPDMGESLVGEVFQRGYRLGDKIIRFAMVKVVN